jgi:hypothetical protein
MAQMAHHPPQTVQVLPENEDVVGKAWTRGLSAALKGAGRVTQEPSIYIDIN